MRLAIAAAVVLTALLGQQKPAPANGAISGTVIDGSTGAPVAEAFVTLIAQPSSLLPGDYQGRQMTDARGRFVFMNLPESGRFQISAGKYGYLDGGYGRDTSPLDPLRSIELSSGRWIGGLRVTIWRPSAISGRVVDEAGAPVIGVFVRAYARIRIGARDDLAAGPLSVTDDTGQYRIGNLLPGRYVVQVPSSQMSVPAATRMNVPNTNVPEGAIDIDESIRLVIGRYPLPPPPMNGRAMTYAATFHPSVASVADASTLAIGFGDERAGIDIALTPVPAVRVSGTVEGPAEALTTMTLRLLPAGMENLGIGAEAATALVAADGSFTFVNVPQGPYTLDAPMTYNGFSAQSGATSGGGFVGSRNRPSIPAPPPRAGISTSSLALDAAPGVNLTISDTRGVAGNRVSPFTARMPITVPPSDLTGVTVRLRPGAVLRGRLMVDADPLKPPPTQPLSFLAFLDPAGAQAGHGRPGGSAAAGDPARPGFEITGIQAGDYFLRVLGNPGWLIKSVEWRGRDFTTIPLDAAANEDISGVVVTVTNRVASLGGALRAADGAVPENAMVVIFPVSAAHRLNAGMWPPRMTSTTPRSTGAYQFAALPAGDYMVAAIDRARASTWRDPAFLAVLERQATRVSLDWGQTITQDLTVVTIR